MKVVLATTVSAVVYFVPYQRMGKALAEWDVLLAGEQMYMIRRIIGVNLLLGLITSILGVARPF